jgi:hypothetical protein
MAITHAIITNVGANAIDRAYGKRAPLVFKRLALGAGNGGGLYESRQSLINQRATGTLVSKRYVSPGNVSLKFVLTNTSFSADFMMNEIGLFCVDPDDAAQEVLLLYGSVSMYPENTANIIEYIPVGQTPVTRHFTFVINLQSEPGIPFAAVQDYVVSIGTFKAFKGETGWLKQIIQLPTFGGEKTVSALVRKQNGDIDTLASMYSSGKMKIVNGGTGAANEEGAISNLGITPAAIGAAISGHTHTVPNATAAADGFISGADKTKIDAMTGPGVVSNTMPYTLGGLKIVIFSISSTGTSASVTVGFDSVCAYATARAADGSRPTISAMTKTTVTFTVTANKTYTGVAVGY